MDLLLIVLVILILCLVYLIVGLGFACFELLVVIVAACLFIVCYDYVACWWLVV